MIHFDCRLSKAWRSFGLQIRVLPRDTFLVSNGNNTIACNFARIALKADKLPLDTEPVTRDRNTSWTLNFGRRRALLKHSWR